MAFRFLRKRKNVRIILWIVAIFIIPGFLLWGVSIGGGKKELYYAAIVNREGITLREYYQRLGEMEDRYRKIFGDRYGEIRDKLNIEKSVLESIIREKLLLQQARKRRIRVLNSEIVEVVKSDPVFKNKEGKFDEDKYKRIIENYPAEELRKIEEDIKKRIMIEKLKNEIIAEGNINVSDKEIEDYIKKNKLKKVDKESIRKMLLWQKREKYFNDWYNKIRAKSKIIIYLPLKTSQISEKKNRKEKE